jgi:hypothetical protein
MTSPYFSDREGHSRPRTSEELSEVPWGGIVALVLRLSLQGAFAEDFPAQCPDGPFTIETNEQTLSLALRAEVAGAEWHPDAHAMPPTAVVLDFIEFCFKHVSQASQGGLHAYFQHYHLLFDREAGREAFQEAVNLIFRRNGLAYELGTDGRIQRLAPLVLREALAGTSFRTGDTELDALLETARSKFTSPELAVRREALEKLWDGWERLKTVIPARDKRASVSALLDRASADPIMRAALEAEATELTRLGNTLQIRHFETSKIPVQNSAQVDYLFHRLFAMVSLLLNSL